MQEGLIAVALVVGMMMLRWPVAFAFLIVGFAGFASHVGFASAINLTAMTANTQLSQQVLLTIPLFILMGVLAGESGIATDLFDMSYKWLGRIRGGLGMGTFATCAMFAATTGSSLACASAIAKIAEPQMRRYGYDPKISAGIIAAGGTLGILIPPSTSFIIYAMLTEQSIGKLFIAGILPGILMTAMFMVVLAIWAAIKPTIAPPGPSFGWSERFKSMRGVIGMLLLVAMVLGGLFLGVVTPTESGAIGVGGCLVIGAVRHRLNAAKIWNSLRDTLMISGSIMIIFVGAMTFMAYLGVIGFAASLSQAVIVLGISPTLVLVGILMVYLLLGMFFDSLTMTLLTIPIFYPMIVKLGFDPILFAVLFVITVEMGLCTPPVGMNVYVVQKSIPDVSASDIFKYCAPFLLAMIATIAIIMVFPQIALYLPSIMIY